MTVKEEKQPRRKYHGKVIGTLLGFAFGGPFGALLGLAIGHSHDAHPADKGVSFWQTLQESYKGFSPNVQQSAFTIGVIVLGAKMAKADGRVTQKEIEAFKRVFNVAEAQVVTVGRIFDNAVRSNEGFEPYAFQLAQMFRHNPAVLEQVLGGLFIIAAADSGGLSPIEQRFLERVGAIFDFSIEDFSRIAARSGVRVASKEKPREESYAILGLQETATVEQIKITYRALIRKHHPDKLVAQGMPPEFIATANEKMKRINGAYDTICKARGIK